MCVIFLFSFFCSFFCSWVWNPVLPIFCLFDNWEQTGWLFAGFSLCYHEVRSMSSINRPWLNPLTPMSVQDRISPFNINYILGRKLMRMKKISRRDYKLIQYQILQINILRFVWQTVRRINNLILGIKGSLKAVFVKTSFLFFSPLLCFFPVFTFGARSMWRRVDARNVSFFTLYSG